MYGKPRRSSRAMERLGSGGLLILVLASAFIQAGPATAASGSTFTLTTFANDTATQTLHFRAPCWTNSTQGFELPFDANVTSAAVTVTRGAADTGVSGNLRLFFSGVRDPDGYANLSDTTPSMRVELNASAMNDFIHSPSLNTSGNNGSALVPLRVQSCSFPKGWDITFSDVQVVYFLGDGPAPVNHRPSLTETFANLTVLEGQSVLAGVDLKAHFTDQDGDPLTFVAGAEDPSADGWPSVSVSVDGNDLRISSALGWAGSLVFRVMASDPQNATAWSNPITLTVLRPDAPPSFHGPIADVRLTSGTAALAVVDASGYFEDPNAMPLTYAIEVDQSGASWAQVEVALRGSMLDVLRAGDSNFSGSACLALKATDENGSSALSNRFCLVFHAVAAAAPPAAVPTAIQAAGPVALDNLTAGNAYSFTVTPSRPLDDGTEILWYVDGRMWSQGPELTGVALTPGKHEIRVEFVSDAGTSTYSQSVMAVARPVPPVSPFAGAVPYAFAMTLAVIGLAWSRTERGRFFLVGALVGAIFARLKGESLLNHFVRGRLYQVINEHPGIRFNELKRLAEVPNGSAVHHLKVLAKGGLIRIETDGAKTRFFAVGARLDEDEYGLIGADADILTAVQEQPGISIGALSKRVERSPSSTSRAVTRLASLGYLRRTRSGKGASVFPQLKA